MLSFRARQIPPSAAAHDAEAAANTLAWDWRRSASPRELESQGVIAAELPNAKLTQLLLPTHCKCFRNLLVGRWVAKFDAPRIGEKGGRV